MLGWRLEASAGDPKDTRKLYENTVPNLGARSWVHFWPKPWLRTPPVEAPTAPPGHVYKDNKKRKV